MLINIFLSIVKPNKTSLNLNNDYKFKEVLLNLLHIFTVMTTSTPEKADGLKALQDAIDKIKDTITTAGGVFNIQMAVSNSTQKYIFRLSIYNLVFHIIGIECFFDIFVV